MFEVNLEVLLKHHLESVKSKTLSLRLNTEEVSDGICTVVISSRAGGYSQSWGSCRLAK
jgi:hypothetical protein